MGKSRILRPMLGFLIVTLAHGYSSAIAEAATENQIEDSDTSNFYGEPGSIKYSPIVCGNAGAAGKCVEVSRVGAGLIRVWGREQETLILAGKQLNPFPESENDQFLLNQFTAPLCDICSDEAQNPIGQSCGTPCIWNFPRNSNGTYRSQYDVATCEREKAGYRFHVLIGNFRRELNGVIREIGAGAILLSPECEEIAKVTHKDGMIQYNAHLLARSQVTDEPLQCEDGKAVSTSGKPSMLDTLLCATTFVFQASSLGIARCETYARLNRTINNTNLDLDRLIVDAGKKVAGTCVGKADPRNCYQTEYNTEIITRLRDEVKCVGTAL